MDLIRNGREPGQSCSNSRPTDIVVIRDSDSDGESSSSSTDELGLSAASPKHTHAHTIDGGKATRKRDYRLVYANVNFDRNGFLPWRTCRYCKKSVASSEIKNDGLIEIHSDDEDGTVYTIPMDEIDLNATAAAYGADADIVNLDSDEEEDVIEYHIVESKDSSIGVRKVPAYSLALYDAPREDAELPDRMRIIARRNADLMPYTKSQASDERYYLYSSDRNAFYAGIVGQSRYQFEEKWHYLVFFDDGHAQYVAQNDIRTVYGLPEFKYVHPNAKKFFEYYFNGPEKEKVPELTAYPGETVSVHVNGSFEPAIILNTFIPIGCEKPQLFHVCCQKWNRYEWIYTGSPRLKKIWKYMTKAKGLWIYNPEADASLTELSSGSEDDEEYPTPAMPLCPVNAIDDAIQKTIHLDPLNIVSTYRPPPKHPRRHTCNRECIQAGENHPAIFKYAPLDRPLLSGWRRKQLSGKIEYTTPCGRLYKRINAILGYLIKTNSRLTIDCFSLEENLRCLYERATMAPDGRGGIRDLNDLIDGGNQERMRIPVISITGNYPQYKRYVLDYHKNPRSKKIPGYLQAADTSHFARVSFRSCCDCTDNCMDKNKCLCWRLTRSGQKGELNGYTNKRLLAKVEHGIYECNSGCRCNKQCLNRVITSHIEVKLEVFETTDRGFGVRTQTDLPKGTYICCYFGDLLHGKTADLRGNRKGAMYGDEYFVTLDHIEMVERKDNYESDVAFDESDAEEERPSKVQKLNASMQNPRKPNLNRPQFNFISYYPTFSKMKETLDVTQRTELFGKDEEPFVVDGRFRGNVSRFVNHSCDPNCFPQPIFLENHDLRFPYLALFSTKFIEAGTELTWDYCYQVGGVEGREVICRCGAATCRGRLL